MTNEGYPRNSACFIRRCASHSALESGFCIQCPAGGVAGTISRGFQWKRFLRFMPANFLRSRQDTPMQCACNNANSHRLFGRLVGQLRETRLPAQRKHDKTQTEHVQYLRTRDSQVELKVVSILPLLNTRSLLSSIANEIDHTLFLPQ